MSTGNPTYWPTDNNKSPDLINFFIPNKISKSCIKLAPGFDLNSEYSPIYMTVYEKAIKRKNLVFWRISLQIGNIFTRYFKIHQCEKNETKLFKNNKNFNLRLTIMVLY